MGMSIEDTLEKISEALKDNEDASVSGENNVYPDPPGDRPESDSTPQYSTGVVHESHEDRSKLLDRIFSDVAGYAAKDRSLIASSFVHGTASASEAHSPLLNRKTASYQPAPTLAEQVVALFGRR